MNSTPTPLDATLELAALYKAAGDGLRLEILRALRQDSYGVSELCQIFAAKQSGMSHHLKVLARAGLVTTRREGNSIFYRRPLLAVDDREQAPLRAVLQAADQVLLSTVQEQRINQIRQQRAEASRAFFARIAEQLREQHELIADHSLYAEAARDLLDSCQLPSTALALEIGPGEGLFLPELARRFTRVIALDNSAEMLEQARMLANDQKLTNIEFVLGELDEQIPATTQADCIVLQMVLHHLPTPADMFASAAARLAPGGSLIISDLSRHDQSWVQASCGDLWLGFDASDLSSWARAAGLGEGESLYLSLRNGFQIQVRRFMQPAEAHLTKGPCNE